MASNLILRFSPSMISRDSLHVSARKCQSLDREVVHVVCIGKLLQPVTRVDSVGWTSKQLRFRARRPEYVLG